jgi:hypothetical protein
VRIDAESLVDGTIYDALVAVHLMRNPAKPTSFIEAIHAELEYRGLTPSDAATHDQLTKGIISAVGRSSAVHDLAYRLPMVFSSQLGAQSVPFSHWDWLAEDLLEARSRFA